MDRCTLCGAALSKMIPAEDGICIGCAGGRQLYEELKGPKKVRNLCVVERSAQYSCGACEKIFAGFPNYLGMCPECAEKELAPAIYCSVNAEDRIKELEFELSSARCGTPMWRCRGCGGIIDGYANKKHMCRSCSVAGKDL